MGRDSSVGLKDLSVELTLADGREFLSGETWEKAHGRTPDNCSLPSGALDGVISAGSGCVPFCELSPGARVQSWQIALGQS